MATFKFSKGYRSSLMTPGLNYYFVSKTGRCEDLQLAAALAWTKADGKIYPSPGNQLTTILARTIYIVSKPIYNGIAMSNTHCERRATFTPLAGHQYAVVSRSVVGGQCDIEVIDQDSGMAPTDLEVEDGATCDRVFQRDWALSHPERRR